MDSTGSRSSGWLALILMVALFAVFGLTGCSSRSGSTDASAAALAGTEKAAPAASPSATPAASPTASPATSPTASPATSPSGHPTALVYRGPAACDGCPEAAAALMSRNGFAVHYIGKGQEYAFTAEALSSAAVYVQPGGADSMSVDQGWQIMQQDNPGVGDVVRKYITDGGHYLGLCMGGYLAGTPGFGLLSPGDSEQYIATPGATVTTTDNTLISVTWRDQPHQMYFQDGPAFVLDGQPAEILARYQNGPIAAAVLPVGAGRVAFVGPHPEATSDWYAEYGLADHSAEGAALGDDLLAALLK